MFLAFQAVTWSLVQMCGCISGTRPAQNCSTFLQLVACYCNSTVSSRPLSYRSTTLICGTTITQEGIKLTKTVTWIWKRGEAGGGAGGEGEPTQIGLFVSSTQHWKRNLWVCGGLKTSLFLTYCKQLLPEDKTSWSFLQEISKCLCLERQVSGTHSKAISQKSFYFIKTHRKWIFHSLLQLSQTLTVSVDKCVLICKVCVLIKLVLFLPQWREMYQLHTHF